MNFAIKYLCKIYFYYQPKKCYKLTSFRLMASYLCHILKYTNTYMISNSNRGMSFEVNSPRVKYNKIEILANLPPSVHGDRDGIIFYNDTQRVY